MNNSRQRWAKLNRDKDLEKSPKILDRKNPKRKSKPLGHKTRDKFNPDTKDVAKDKDLKKD
jgi:hypothetical protein